MTTVNIDPPVTAATELSPPPASTRSATGAFAGPGIVWGPPAVGQSLPPGGASAARRRRLRQIRTEIGVLRRSPDVVDSRGQLQRVDNRSRFGGQALDLLDQRLAAVRSRDRETLGDQDDGLGGFDRFQLNEQLAQGSQGGWRIQAALPDDRRERALHTLVIGRERHAGGRAEAGRDHRQAVGRLEPVDESLDRSPVRVHPLEADVRAIDEQHDETPRPGVSFDEYGSGAATTRAASCTPEAAGVAGVSAIHSAADDASPATVDFHDKVARLQIEDRTSVAVNDRDVDGDDFDAALEPRRLLILRVGRLRGDQRDGDDNMKSSHNCTSGQFRGRSKLSIAGGVTARDGSRSSASDDWFATPPRMEAVHPLDAKTPGYRHRPD